MRTSSPARRAKRSRADLACWIAALVSACGVAACGGDEAPTQQHGVRHLELRLEDGGSSVERLAARGVQWVEQHELRVDAVGAWRLRHGTVEGPSPSGGVIVGGVAGAGAPKPIDLDRIGSIDAATVDRIEIDVDGVDAGQAGVFWISSTVPPRADGFSGYARIFTADGGGPQTLKFSLGLDPAWDGEITRLLIAPKAFGKQRYALKAIRLGAEAGIPGVDRADAAAGHAGIVALGDDGRRAWPTDWDVPLRAKVDVPPRATLHLACAVDAPHAERAEPATLSVEGRTTGGAWTRIDERTWPRGELSTWRAWSVDLAPFAGEALELRVVASRGERATFGAVERLERARVLWTTPAVSSRDALRRPDVVLITLDTMRADSIGAYGTGADGIGADGRAARESATPRIDAFAADAILFEQAWSASSTTSPSHASIFTGLAVQDHGLVDNLTRLAGEHVTLAERLRDGGYLTAAAVSVRHLHPSLCGLGQGFERYSVSNEQRQRDGTTTIDAAIAWLDEWRELDVGPFFLWVHLFDAHSPYGSTPDELAPYLTRLGLALPPRIVDPPTVPEAATRARNYFYGDANNADYVRTLYRAGATRIDRHVGRLLDALERRGTLASTAVLLTADHGESLGENGDWFDHHDLFEPVTRVPWIVSLPGFARGERIEPRVSTLDLAPTLLELLELAPPTFQRGESLLGLLRGESRRSRRVWFESDDRTQVGFRDDDHHVIWTRARHRMTGASEPVEPGTLQVIDLRASAPSDAAVRAKLADDVQRWIATAREAPAAQSEISPADREALEALGYVEGR